MKIYLITRTSGFTNGGVHIFFQHGYHRDYTLIDSDSTILTII